MASFQSSIGFGIIGLGRFGFSLAETLADSGREVLVLDNCENKIRLIQHKVNAAFVVTQLDKAALEEAGIQNCGTVVVCIGEQLEASIMTALNAIELGVPRVIAKAVSAEHGRVLEKIGAEVVYPERDQAVRLAHSLARPSAMELIELSGTFAISELRLSEKLNGKSIRDLDIRQKYRLNVIAIVRGSDTIIEIEPNTRLSAGDLLAVVGKKENIRAFERLFTP